jgi:hypothetical protein
VNRVAVREVVTRADHEDGQRRRAVTWELPSVALDMLIPLSGMSDEVGVEPERLAELASALETLRDVLADNVALIVNMLEQYWDGGTGAPISLLPLKQAQARSVEDVRLTVAGGTQRRGVLRHDPGLPRQFRYRHPVQDR